MAESFPTVSMSNSSGGAAKNAPSSAAGPWLWNPAADLLLGCGLLYAAIFVVMAFAGPAIRLAQPAFLSPLLILLVTTPHYGATLVRVYEDTAERRRYVLFTVWLSLLICFVIGLAVFNPVLASLIVTLLFTWSPWHYTASNYGVAVLFLRRRGVEVSVRAKRLLYASFVISFAMVAVSMNVQGNAPSKTPLGYTATDVHFVSLNIPAQIADLLLALLLVAFVATLVGAWVDLSRKARVKDLIPTALLSLAQVLWFTLPLLVFRWQLAPGIESINIEHRAYYFFWVAAAHCVQYLWCTAYYERASSRWRGVLPYWGKVILAGSAVWTFPVLLLGPMGIGRFAPDSGGALSYETGLALLVSAGVNFHHFMLDGVIWKLRNMRIASILIRDTPEEDSEFGPSRLPRPFARRASWGLAGVALVISLFVNWQRYVSTPSAWERSDYAAVARSQDRLGWLGYDSHAVRADLGDAVGAKGDLAGSIHHYEASLRLKPRVADLHYRLATALRADKQTELAIAQFREALAIHPNMANARYGLGNALASEARYIEAIDEYRLAIAADPDFAQAHNNLGNALRTQGDLDGAIKHYREALRIKPGYANADDNLSRALRQNW